MGLGKLKRRLFRARLAARRFEGLRRLMSEQSTQSQLNARDFAHAIAIFRKNIANHITPLNLFVGRSLKEFR